MKIKLQYVHYMPAELAAGILYVSKEFNTAAHLCACGCGAKVRTPLTPTEWTLTVSAHGPTLRPSIGNWQLPCKSHYVITGGNISWSNQWTDTQIANGKRREDMRRKIYFERTDNKKDSNEEKLWDWIKRLFR